MRAAACPATNASNHFIEIIPFPSACPQPQDTIYTNVDERRRSRRYLESLNAEASNSQSTSYRLQQTLQELRQLLKPKDLTELYVKILFHPPVDFKLTRLQQVQASQSRASGHLQRHLAKGTDPTPRQFLQHGVEQHKCRLQMYATYMHEARWRLSLTASRPHPSFINPRCKGSSEALRRISVAPA